MEVESEQVLLSLRHGHPQLHLGVREARGLAASAAEWLRRGVSAADLRRVLISELPGEGVRSAVGFLRHRLREKCPQTPAPPAHPGRRPDGDAQACWTAPELAVCDAPGDDHVFRARDGETTCGPCTRRAADPGPGEETLIRTPWRERVAAEAVGAQPGPPA